MKTFVWEKGCPGLPTWSLTLENGREFTVDKDQKGYWLYVDPFGSDEEYGPYTSFDEVNDKVKQLVLN